MLETLRLSWLVTVRNLVIYRKNFWLNASPIFMDPAMYLLALGLGLGAYVNDLDGLSYARYTAPGLAVSTALYTAFFELSYGFYVRYEFESIYKAMMTTPIGPVEIVLGEFVWVGIKGLFMVSCVSIFFTLFGLIPLYALPLMPVLGFLTGLCCGALGLLSSAMVKNINTFQTIHSGIINPMFFFSGVFFPVADLPTPLQWIANLSPVYHGVHLAQVTCRQGYQLDALLYHGSALLILAAVFIPLAVRKAYPKLYS